MRYFFLFPLLLLSLVLSRPLQAFTTITQEDFIIITDPALGSYVIEKALISVKKYVDFLNAVGIKKDPHGLYRPEMKDVVVYHSSGWFAEGYYEAVPGKADSPMGHITFEDAIRYCNWKEWREPTAQEIAKIEQMGQEVTESGAYVFEKGINEENFITRNDDAIYALPSKDQLAVYINQTEGAPFFEWTSSKIISKTPDVEEGEESWLNVALLFDQSGDEPQMMNGDETNENVGFRLIMKKQIFFTLSSSSHDSEVGSNAVSTSQKNQTTADTKNTKGPSLKDRIGLALACASLILLFGPFVLFWMIYFFGIASMATLGLAEVGLDLGVLGAVDAGAASVGITGEGVGWFSSSLVQASSFPEALARGINSRGAEYAFY